LEDGPTAQSGSGRASYVVFALVAVLAVALLAAAIYLGVRTMAGSGSGTGRDDKVDAGPGSVRFRLVEAKRTAAPGTSCPKGRGWVTFDQQCLRLGGGFPAAATARAAQEGGAPVVAVVLHPPADQRFASYTRRYQNRQIAVLAGGRVLAAPVVTGAITGGELQISGSFTTAETERLADLVNGS
jgi:preprotein translocase subunit SecD